MTVPTFRRRKTGEPLVVLTAYDAATTAVAEAGGVDCILVGDSLGMVVLGYENTLQVTVDDMVHHAAAVGRVRRNALLVVDMPWLSFHVNQEESVRNAARLVQETGADAVKLEGESNGEAVARLKGLSNKKLLRLSSVAKEIADRGGKDKVIAAVGTAMGRAKDSDYLAKLGSFSSGRLMDMLRAAEKRTKKSA